MCKYVVEEGARQACGEACARRFAGVFCIFSINILVVLTTNFVSLNPDSIAMLPGAKPSLSGDVRDGLYIAMFVLGGLLTLCLFLVNVSDPGIAYQIKCPSSKQAVFDVFEFIARFRSQEPAFPSRSGCFWQRDPQL